MSLDESDDGLRSYDAEAGSKTSSLDRLREWLLVEGDRLAVTGLLSAGVFATLFVLFQLGVVAFVNDDSITRMAGGMIAGTFSLVTLVVSINQLILSHEFTSVSEFRDRFSSIMEWRRDVEESARVKASPAEPTELLELLAIAVQDRASALPDAVADHPDADLRELVTTYADDVTDSADDLRTTIDQKDFSTFDALSAAIGYGDGWQLFAARQLANRYGEELSEEATGELEELVETLELFAVAEENFKTTYLQRELTKFSQLTVLVGVPAIFSAVVLGFMYAEATGPAIPEAYLPFVTPALTTVVFSPLMLLAAFALRTSTISRRTASIGPMQPTKDADEGPFDVTYAESDSPNRDTPESV